MSKQDFTLDNHNHNQDEQDFTPKKDKKQVKRSNRINSFSDLDFDDSMFMSSNINLKNIISGY